MTPRSTAETKGENAARSGPPVVLPLDKKDDQEKAAFALDKMDLDSATGSLVHEWVGKQQICIFSRVSTTTLQRRHELNLFMTVEHIPCLTGECLPDLESNLIIVSDNAPIEPTPSTS
jgi:hypothetical protein